MKTFLTDQVKITRVENAAAAGTTDLETDILDMAGFEGVVFIAHLGDVTSGSVLNLKAQQNTANSTSGMADIVGAGAGATAGASDYDNKDLILDLQQVEERYVRGVLVIDTQNAVVNGITAIQYGPRALPVTQPSSVVQHDKVAISDEA